MSDFVGDDVSLGKIATCTEAFLELTEKTEIDINAPIFRTIERPGRATGETATRLNHVCKEHQLRLFVLAAHLPKDLMPRVFGVGENDGDKSWSLIARTQI